MLLNLTCYSQIMFYFTTKECLITSISLKVVSDKQYFTKLVDAIIALIFPGLPSWLQVVVTLLH